MSLELNSSVNKMEKSTTSNGSLSCRMLASLGHGVPLTALGEHCGSRSEPPNEHASVLDDVAAARAGVDGASGAAGVTEAVNAELDRLRESLVEGMSNMAELSRELDRFKKEYHASLASVIGYVEAVAEAAISSIQRTNRRFDDQFLQLKASVEGRHDTDDNSGKHSQHGQSETASLGSSAPGEGVTPKIVQVLRSRSASPARSKAESDLTFALKRVIQEVREHNEAVVGSTPPTSTQAPSNMLQPSARDAAGTQQQQQEQRQPQQRPMRQIPPRRSLSATGRQASSPALPLSSSPRLPSPLASLPSAMSSCSSGGNEKVAFPAAKVSVVVLPPAAPTPVDVQSAMSPSVVTLAPTMVSAAVAPEQGALARSVTLPAGSPCVTASSQMWPGAVTRQNLPASLTARAPLVGDGAASAVQVHRPGNAVGALFVKQPAVLTARGPVRMASPYRQVSQERGFECSTRGCLRSGSPEPHASRGCQSPPQVHALRQVRSPSPRLQHYAERT